MLKHIVIVFILGVLLREASSDIDCFVEKEQGAIYLPFAAKILCNDFVKNFQETLKSCGITNINLTNVERHVKEVCTGGSSLRKDFESSEQCFYKNGIGVLKCVIFEGITRREQVKEFCDRRQEVYKCMRDGIGTPCGEAGLNAVSRNQDAQESYVKEICALVGGAAANSILMWIVVLCVSITILKSY